MRLLAINSEGASYRPVKSPLQSCRPLRRSERNLARGERFLRTPGIRAYVTNAPRQGRGEFLQPLPGCVPLFLFYPGVRFAHPRLSVRARIRWHFGASAGQADARRRDAGDVVISSRSGNAADTRLSPPRPGGLRLPRPANHCGLPVMIQLGMEAAAKCEIILARALSLLMFVMAAGVAPAADFPHQIVTSGLGYFPVAVRLRNGDVLAVIRGGAAA